MINHVVSESCKLVQREYKSRHTWVGKVINRELYKKLKFDHKNKWNMHNTESVLENETHKFLWDFYVQMDHLISTRRPDLVIVNNNLPNRGICPPGRPQSKLKRKRKERQILGHCKGTGKKKTTMEDESDGDSNCNWCTRHSHLSFGKGIGRIGNKKSCGKHSNDNILKIGQKTEKNPGDLRRLAVTCCH